METTRCEEKTKEKISGIVKRIRFKNDDNGFMIFSLEDEKGNVVSVTGTFFKLEENDAVTVVGDFSEHPKYGRQFKADHYEVYLPKDEVSLREYLSNGMVKGIGPVLAERIIKKFGTEALDVMEHDPIRLATVDGIGKRKAELIQRHLEDRSSGQNAMIFLANYGISQKLGIKIYRFYKEKMYEVLQKNPYKMIEELKGVGFRTADSIALANGIPKTSAFRIRAGILSCFDQFQAEGHVCVLKSKFLKKTVEILEVEETLISDMISKMLTTGEIILENLKVGEVLYRKHNYLVEKETAEMISSLCMKFPHKKVEFNGKHLDETQQSAVQIAADNGFMILTGGPGTGKTTTTNLIIDYFISRKHSVLLAAPTGRAAKRMQEATGRASQTIHRLLEVGHDGFARNEENPLECDVLVIDEISMIDIFLMHSLLLAIPQGTHVILVGDKNQLPSVGPGNVLADILQSGSCPVVELKKVYRQAEGSDIVGNAHRILNNEPIKLSNSKDFFFKRIDEPEALMEALVHYTTESLPAFTGETEIQVLSPIKQRTLGVENLNLELQKKINPAQKEVFGFHVNDKVIQLRNNYDKERIMPTGLVCNGVFNGDMGKITKIDYEDEYIYVRFEDNSIAKYDFNEHDDLMLAYALTIHKSQGSEYPVVVVPVYDYIPMLTTRNLIYTAITRAKKAILLIGRWETFVRIVRNTTQNKRYTGLAERLNTKN